MAAKRDGLEARWVPRPFDPARLARDLVEQRRAPLGAVRDDRRVHARGRLEGPVAPTHAGPEVDDDSPGGARLSG